jgi:hypothetical protein
MPSPSQLLTRQFLYETVQSAMLASLEFRRISAATNIEKAKKRLSFIINFWLKGLGECRKVKETSF